MNILIRDARETDIAVIQRIYAHHVLHGLATFEEVPPTAEELLERRKLLVAGRYPQLVATLDDEIVGYAYAGPYRARPAYRHSVEDSVYVAQGMAGRGIGTALLTGLLARCERGPWRQMVAVIGDSANAASIALHRKHGFTPAGSLAAVGFKLGRWVDTVFMQRALGPGGSTPPD
jgi:phosphinothricin acetyltransferase